MTTSDDPPGDPDADGGAPPTDDERAPRRRAWPWLVGTLALVAVLVGVGVGVFTLLDRTFGADDAAGAEEGSAVVEEGLAEGDAYGDNAALDELWDACEAGEGAACDDLYEQSDLGSGYETFGYTCGERLAETQERPVSCEEVVAGG